MSFQRAEAITRLRSEDTFDVLVIGGGITGVGCALDAATRGLKVALVERHDFSAGTSSKSSKLVHGGLRYLQQKEFRLVYEALAERQILRHTAPHIVRILPFLLPVFKGKDNLFDKRIARIVGTSMWLYDVTGGARIGKLHKKISADEARVHIPTLRADRIAYGYLYYDARADDSRLTVTIARTAAERGATLANYVNVTGMRKEHGKCIGVTVQADGETFDINARVVINATGVWSDDVRALDEGSHPNSIRPAKGMHITVPWSKVRNDIAAVVPVPKDRRSVFVVPWGDDGNGKPQFTYIGTTDTDYSGSIDDPQCTPEDIEYCLRAVNHSCDADLTQADVLGTWAGLRPLVNAKSGRTADLSRRHSIRRSASGVVSVNGGKLTTYRIMAKDAVNDACQQLGTKAKSTTKTVRLIGAEGWDESSLSDHLRSRYGSTGAAVMALAAADATLNEPLVPGLPYLKAEAVFAVRHEMARTLDDVLSRRTRARLLARDDSAAAAPGVAELIGAELGWSHDQIATAVVEYRASVDHERLSAELPLSDLEAHLEL